jgi:hypothetical protein
MAIFFFILCYKPKIPAFLPGFFYRYLFVSVLTKASRTISKIVAKIKPGICFCECHYFSKVRYGNEMNKVILLFFKKYFSALYAIKKPSLKETALRLPAK